MLPRSARLRSTVAIQRVLREGRSITTPYVRVCVLPAAGPATRIACVVGKTVHRSAVRRHRYQRWLREAARLWQSAHEGTKAYDMVWVGRPGMVEMKSLSAMQDDLLPRLSTLLGAS